MTKIIKVVLLIAMCLSVGFASAVGPCNPVKSFTVEPTKIAEGGASMVCAEVVNCSGVDWEVTVDLWDIDPAGARRSPGPATGVLASGKTVKLCTEYPDVIEKGLHKLGLSVKLGEIEVGRGEATLEVK